MEGNLPESFSAPEMDRLPDNQRVSATDRDSHLKNHHLRVECHQQVNQQLHIHFMLGSNAATVKMSAVKTPSVFGSVYDQECPEYSHELPKLAKSTCASVL